MGRGMRWLVAGIVAAAAFAVPTVTCGLWVLPSLVKDAGARWAVASAMGAAVAALAVMWGQSFASGNSLRAGSAEARGARSIAIIGRVQGNVSTGDNGRPSAPAARATPLPSPGSIAPPAQPGSVVAAGERSIALGDGLVGNADTGDDSNNRPRL